MASIKLFSRQFNPLFWQVGIALLVAISLVLIASETFKTQSNPLEIVRKGLVVRSSELYLGEVYYQDKLEHSFTISNRSDKPIEISSWSTSCNCSIIEPKEILVPANGNVKVKGIVYLPTALKKMTIYEPQNFSVVYVPQILGHKKDYNSPIVSEGWLVQGIILPTILGNRTRSLGTFSTLEQPITERPLHFNLWKSTIPIKAASIKNIFAVTLVDSNPSNMTIHLIQKKKLPLGSYTDHINVTLQNTDTGAEYSCLLYVSFNIIDDIEFTPPIIYNNDLIENKCMINIRSFSKKKFRIVDIDKKQNNSPYSTSFNVLSDFTNKTFIDFKIEYETSKQTYGKHFFLKDQEGQ